MDELKDALRQGQQLSELLDRVGSLCEARRTSKDRVLHWLQDSFTFQQGQNTVQNLVFNVPKGYDFEAARFNCYLEVRDLLTSTPSGAGSERVFRPTQWFTSQGKDPSTRDPPSADAVLELTYSTPEGTTRRYQNAAFWVAQTFSDYTNANSVVSAWQYTRTESPAGMVFDPFYLLARGSTLTCRVTPVFSKPYSSDFANEFIYEYRIRGMLEGYKRL